MRGLVFAFLGATLWGLSSVCSDYLMSAFALTPLALTAVRTVVAAILFGGFAFATQRQTISAMLHDKATVKGLLVFGSVGLFMCQATYIISISMTNAGTATVMQSLNIVLIPLATWAMGRSKLAPGEVIGAVLAFLSVLAIATQGSIGTLAMPLGGLVWGLVNGVSESFYIMYPSQLFKRWGSLAVTSCAMAVGAVVAVVALVIQFVASPGLAVQNAQAFARFTALGWVSLVGVCVLGTFVAFGLFLKGVEMIGPVKSALLGAMEPVSSAVLCTLLLHTPFTGWDWLGLVLMVGTIFLVTLVKPKEQAS